MEFLSKNTEDTKNIATKFVSGLKTIHPEALVFGLCGELGAGKTTFMKYVALAFGIKETIQSPTFVIMKRYKLINSVFDFLIHIDAYRMESGQEILNLGWLQIVNDSKNIIFIEWPDKIKDVMPPHKKIFFEHVGENERKIIFE